MPRKPQPWFRLYAEVMHDDKILSLTPPQRWLWIAVLSAASQSPERGRLLTGGGAPMSLQQLARLADLKPSTVRVGSELMTRLGMLEIQDGVIVVTNWSERQFESDHINWRVRAGKGPPNDSPNVPPTGGGSSTPTSVVVATPETENRSVDGEEGFSDPLVTREPRVQPEPDAPPGRAAARTLTDQDDRAAADARRRREQDAAIDADLNRAPRNPAALADARALFDAALAANGHHRRPDVVDPTRCATCGHPAEPGTDRCRFHPHAAVASPNATEKPETPISLVPVPNSENQPAESTTAPQEST